MKKYKNRFQSLLTCLICFISLVTFSACGEASDSSSTSKSDGDVLVVYYVKEHPFYQAALEEYQKNAQVSLELHAFETEEKLAKQYTAEGLAGGGADVVLLSDTSSLDAEKLMTEGICFDLTEYMEQDQNPEQDQNYEKENYFEVVVDAGKHEGKQYILPITFDMGFAVARNTVSELCGNILTDDTDCYEFYQELLACQQLLYDSEEIRLGLCFTSDSTEDFLLYAYHTSGLELTDGKTVSVNSEQLRQLCDFVKAGQEEFQAKNDEMKNSGSKSATLVGYQLLYGNPAAIIRQQEYGYEALFQEKINYFMFPEDTAGGYRATVRDFGLVDAKSDCPEEAYKLLRYLMDYNFYNLGVVYTAGTPVNRNIFESQFYNLSTITEVTMGKKTIPVSAMAEDLVAKIEKQMNQITSAGLKHPDMEQIFAETMVDYINGTADFDTCYQQMCSRLNLYLKER